MLLSKSLSSLPSSKPDRVFQFQSKKISKKHSIALSPSSHSTSANIGNKKQRRNNLVHLNKFVTAPQKNKKSLESTKFDSTFLDLFTKYMLSMKDRFNVGFQAPKNLTISQEAKKQEESLWAEIIDCIFKSYLKGQSLCYNSYSEKNEYPKIFHSMHNRSRFPQKVKTEKIESEEEYGNMFQMWLEHDFSEEEMESGTDCTSQSSDDLDEIFKDQ